jgi:hypothetical protein
MGAVIVISLFVLFLIAAVRDGVDSREWDRRGGGRAPRAEGRSPGQSR